MKHTIGGVQGRGERAKGLFRSIALNLLPYRSDIEVSDLNGWIVAMLFLRRVAVSPARAFVHNSCTLAVEASVFPQCGDGSVSDLI